MGGRWHHEDSLPCNGLIRCDCGACDRQGDVFLRFKLGGVYGLGIQVKRGCYLGVAQQPLNRLYVLAPANQKRRKAMTKIMESESLTRFQANADLEGGGANLVCCHYARAQRRLALQLHGREDPVF